jgi:hypothetical protein
MNAELPPPTSLHHCQVRGRGVDKQGDCVGAVDNEAMRAQEYDFGGWNYFKRRVPADILKWCARRRPQAQSG